MPPASSTVFATTLFLASGLALGAMACDMAAAGLQAGPRGIVTTVQDGDTVYLDSGVKVRLIGIQAPKLSLDRPDVSSWPLAETAKAALSDISLGRMVQLWFANAKADRHGRVLAHMFVEDESGGPPLWAQGRMLSQGMARVYTFADNRACRDELYAAERQARPIGSGCGPSPIMLYEMLTRWPHCWRGPAPMNLLKVAY